MPTATKETYLAWEKKMAPLFREAGALKVVVNWGIDVPDGKVTDFKRAVQAKPNESIVLSWIVWPSKAVRDKAWEMLMADTRMKDMGDMPFDGKRMIFGGFEQALEA